MWDRVDAEKYVSRVAGAMDTGCWEMELPRMGSVGWVVNWLTCSAGSVLCRSHVMVSNCSEWQELRCRTRWMWNSRPAGVAGVVDTSG